MIPIVIDHIASWIRIRTDDPKRAGLEAAHEAAGLARKPLKRRATAQLEQQMTGFSSLMARTEVDLGFVLVSDAPRVEVLGWVVIRFERAHDSVIAEFVDDSVAAPDPERPTEVSTAVTPLGNATRVLRSSRKIVNGGATIATTLTWLWIVESTEGRPTLVRLTAQMTADQNVAMIVPLVDEFALGVRWRRDDEPGPTD